MSARITFLILLAAAIADPLLGHGFAGVVADLTAPKNQNNKNQ